jgi:hypothetical protein
MRMSKAVRSRPFSPIDASWLNNEVPVSTTLIAGLILFDDVTDFDRLAGQIEDRLLRYDRFRQRVRRRALPFTLPVWEPDPDFALDAHFHRTVLPEPGGWLQLKAFIESLLAWPLPHDRPQWQMHFIEHYGTGSALVLCFSHIIADGFASMHLLNAITDAGPDDPAPPPTPEKEPAGLAGLRRTAAARKRAARSGRRSSPGQPRPSNGGGVGKICAHVA